MGDKQSLQDHVSSSKLAVAIMIEKQRCNFNPYS